MDGPEVSVVAAPDPALLSEISDLLDRSERARGHVAVSEQKTFSLTAAVRGGAPSGGTALVAALVARRRGHGALVGVAPLVGDRASAEFAVEVVVSPTAGRPAEVADALVDAALDWVTGAGGGRLRLWASRATAADDDRAAARGFRRERDLLQLRCPLPLDGGDPVAGAAIRTRPFRPGRDEEALLAVNNRAFASHPEQGGWTLASLEEREREPWFDPGGILLLDEGGRLVGFCWTKVHEDSDPPMGEIYVIGVDPDVRGRGWGRALTRAGLDWLAGRGLSVGMLYVDGANTAALTLYLSMGFTQDHVDRAYVVRLDAGTAAAGGDQPTPTR
jgi:mycothiol synthase